MGKTQILGSLVNTILTDSSNNVGIGGAANASFKLQVTGTTNLTGALTGVASTFLGKLTVGSSSLAEGEIGIFETGGNYNFTTFKNGTVRTIIGSQSSTSQGFLGTASNHDLLIKTNDTTRLTIASTGAATFSSSLSVPTATISSSITSPMFRVTPTGTFRVNTDGDAILGYMLRSGSWKGNAENNLAFATDGAYGISFFTNGSASEKMIITSGGNVGIGITSPQSPLEVYSTTGYASSWRFGILSSSPDYPTIRLYAYGSNKLSMIGNNGDGSLWFFVNGNLATQGTAAMTMTSGGVVNVLNDLGVGTATPSGKIHGVGINTSGSNNVLYLENAVATIMLQVRNDGNIRINSTVYNGTTAGSTRTLFVGDGGYFLGGISSIRASKDNIQNIENVNWIYQLNPVTFNYRKKDDEGNYTNETFDESNYGLIAEDTQPIADFLINYNDKEDGSKEMIGIEYSRLITPMLKAIQEQQAQIEELKSLINNK